MFRKLLDRFRRRTDAPGQTDAQAAIESAVQSLSDARARSAEVSKIAGELRQQREINHIRERIMLSLGGTP